REEQRQAREDIRRSQQSLRSSHASSLSGCRVPDLGGSALSASHASRGFLGRSSRAGAPVPLATIGPVEFRRISNLPPYVFKLIDELKVDARRRGVDIIDLGFGNPDIPSPEIAVEKLAEAARLPRNHRYSLSRGIPRMREAVAALYARRFGVELDPETEITNAIGSKEGFTH